MNQKKVTILFVISGVKTNSKGLCPLYCRMTLNKERKQFSTGLFVNPNHWVNKLQKVNAQDANYKFINAQIEQIQIKINNIVLVFQLQDGDCTLDNIYNKYIGVEIKDNTLDMQIVTKLDILFAQLETIKTSMENIPLLLKDFHQQVLTQAVTGKLLGETEFTNFSELEIKIKTGPFGSALHKSDYIDNGMAVINPSHIIKGRIVPDNKISIDENKFHELKRWKLKIMTLFSVEEVKWEEQ